MLKKLKILILIITLSVTLCLMSNTYSRYIADATGSIEAPFAKWQIMVNNEDINKQASTKVSFTPIIDKNENIADNVIAPTSTGYFDITIDPSNTDVAFNYSIDLSVENINMPDLMVSKYAILPDNYIEGDALTFSEITNNQINNNLEKNNKAFTIRVYFEWYDGNDNQMDDDADTIIGTSTDDIKVIINANINFKQIV